MNAEPTIALAAAADGSEPVQSAADRPRLTARELAAYAALGGPLLMTALPLNLLVPDFYAASTGLALATIGWIMLATRLVDAVVDPLLGVWIDAEKARASYARPLLAAAPMLAVSVWLLFHPALADAANQSAAAWLFLCLTGAYVGYSLATVAYQAWGAELAHNDAERARVTGAREGVGLIGVLLGGSLPQWAGYGALASLFVVLLVLALTLLLLCAPRPPRGRVVRNANPYLAFLAPLRHSNTRWLLATFACNALAPAITATAFVFFVADRLQRPQFTGAFLALFFSAGVVSMPLWIRLARRVSLPWLWFAGMLTAIASFVWAYWLPAGATASFIAICVLSGLAFGADLALPPALLARVIDANGDTGQREGSYFGLWNAVNKFTLALAGGAALNLLAALGYARGARDASALAALAATYALVPCLLKLLAASLLAVASRRRMF